MSWPVRCPPSKRTAAPDNAPDRDRPLIDFAKVDSVQWLQGNTGVIVSNAAAGCRDAQRPRNEEEGTHSTEP